MAFHHTSSPLLLLLVLSPLSTEALTGRFLHVSDIHLEPYYYAGFGSTPTGCGCRRFGPWNQTHVDECTPNSTRNIYGQDFCDSSLDLVHSAIDAMSTLVPNPDWIILSGDLYTHEFGGLKDPYSERLEVVKVISDYFDRRFPGVPRLHHAAATMGNNDFFPNYGTNFTDDRQPLLEAYADVWSDHLSDDARDSFVRAGYYSQPLTDDLAVLVLNTVLYSIKITPKSRESDPMGQFKWLETTLAQCRKNKTKVYLAAHIPVGADDSRYQAQMWPDYEEKYISIVTSYPDVIAAQLFGHNHQHSIRLFPATTFQSTGRADTRLAPMLLTSAISPKYGNLPSFRTYTYNATTKELTDWQVFAADHRVADWGQNVTLKWTRVVHSARDRYGVLAGESLYDGLYMLPQRAKTNRTLIRAFVDDKKNIPATCDEACISHETCLLNFPFFNNFDKCFQGTPTPAPSRAPPSRAPTRAPTRKITSTSPLLPMLPIPSLHYRNR